MVLGEESRAPKMGLGTPGGIVCQIWYAWPIPFDARKYTRFRSTKADHTILYHQWTTRKKSNFAAAPPFYSILNDAMMVRSESCWVPPPPLGFSHS